MEPIADDDHPEDIGQTGPPMVDDLNTLRPADQAEAARLVAETAAAGQAALIPSGGRTVLRQEALPRAERPARWLDLSRLTAIVDYPARDQTITIEAGMTAAALAQTLAREGQRLPIDIAQVDQATIGGAMACNVAGPLRAGLGTFRDYVIGLSAIDAQGRRFDSGGRVVKNVAGYDLCKLLVGSRGTLAAITQVTLKLWPRAERSAWLLLTWDRFDEIELALQRLQVSDARPVAVEVFDRSTAQLIAASTGVSLPDRPCLLALAVEGSEREVSWQLDVLKRELASYGPDEVSTCEDASADALRIALTEHAAGSLVLPGESTAATEAVLKTSVLPSRCMELCAQWSRQGVGVQCHAVNGIVYARVPREASARADQLLATLSSAASGCGGQLIPWAGPALDSPLIAPPRATGLMARLRQSLDPNSLWHPSEFIATAT